MSGRSYVEQYKGQLVTIEIAGAHPKHTNYPLLPGDLLVPGEDDTFVKVAPGLCVGGFVLTDEQRETLGEPATYAAGIGGMGYFMSDEDEPA